MNPSNQPHDPRAALDASDNRVEHALHALGQAERDAAPSSLEARVYAGSIDSLRAAAAAGEAAANTTRQPTRHAAGHAPVIAGRIVPNAGTRSAGQSRRRIAIAAGLGAMACVTALWFALRDNPETLVPMDSPWRLADSIRTHPTELVPATDTDAELEAMFLASSMLSTGMDDEIESISASAASLGLSLTDPIGDDWSDTLWTGESL